MQFRHTKEGPDYRHAETQAMRANLAEARRAAAAREPWIVEKAERVAARYLARRDALLAKAARGERAALALLAKAPARQGLHQAAFADWLARLQKRGLIAEVEALPAGGPNAQILDRSGRIVPRLTVPTGDVAGKALNFRLAVPCRGGAWQVFVAHSYIGGDGGSQDNQFQEVRAFLANAAKNADPRTIFVAVCDGAYYVADRGAEKTRLDVLIGMQVGLKTVAVTSKRLPEVLRFLSRMHATMRPAEAAAQAA
jgi:hypothetical protein